MRIEVEAKVILTVLESKEGESVESIAYDVEQKLNELGIICIPGHPQVGLRVHFKNVKAIAP